MDRWILHYEQLIAKERKRLYTYWLYKYSATIDFDAFLTDEKECVHFHYLYLQVEKYIKRKRQLYPHLEIYTQEPIHR